jgi:hypothetical protein
VLASAVRGTVSSGSGVDDGHPALMSSYRSELGGILALLYIIYRICKYYDLSSGKAVFYCDNKVAIGNSFKSAPSGITPFFQPDYDLLGLIHELVTLILITVVGNWVKGHYTGTERQLQHDLNDEADKLASNHLFNQSPPFNTHKCPQPFPGYRVLLYDNSVITFKYYSVLLSALHEQELVTYILRKTKWTTSTFHLVHWTAHSSAYRKLTVHRQIQISKLIHNLANTNRQNHIYYKALHCARVASWTRQLLSMSLLVLSLLPTLYVLSCYNNYRPP